MEAENLNCEQGRLNLGNDFARTRAPFGDSAKYKLNVLAGLICVCCLSNLRGDTALVFNEIMYHPQTNEAAFEWVELYNQMAVDLDVSGWKIQNGIDYT